MLLRLRMLPVGLHVQVALGRLHRSMPQVVAHHQEWHPCIQLVRRRRVPQPVREAVTVFLHFGRFECLCNWFGLPYAEIQAPSCSAHRVSAALQVRMPDSGSWTAGITAYPVPTEVSMLWQVGCVVGRLGGRRNVSRGNFHAAVLLSSG